MTVPPITDVGNPGTVGFPVIAQGQATAADHIAAGYLHLRVRKVFLFLLVVMAVFFVFVFLLTWSPIVPLLFGWVFGYMCIYYPYRVRRSFRQIKMLSEPVSFEERPGGLYFRRTNGEGLVSWEEILRWRANSKVLLLYIGDRMYIVIPRHFFASDADYTEFKALLTSKVGAEK